MTVPLIVECFYSFQLGGSERVGLDLALACKERGYRVAAISMYDATGPIRTELEANGINCAALDMHGHTWLRRRLVPLDFWRYLRRMRPYVVHFQHALTLNLGGLAAYLARVPRIVMTEHAEGPFSRMKAYRKSSARSFYYADVVTSVHSGLERYMVEQMGLPPRKSLVVPNGIPLGHVVSLQHRLELRSQLGFKADDLIYVYLGRLHIDKDVESLLAAFERLPPQDTRLKLLIIGDGVERQRLEASVANRGIGAKVRFLGARMDARQLLAAADVFVLSSRTEGLPMALLESMAAGLACIATSVGATPDVLADEVGILVPPADVDRLASALERICSDASLRAKLGAAGRKRVAERFSVARSVDGYLSAFGLEPYYSASDNTL